MVSPMDMPKRMNKDSTDYNNTVNINNLAYSTDSSGEVVNNFNGFDFTPNDDQITFWFRCYRKQRYRSKATADWVANYYRVNSEGDQHDMLNCYKCDYCSYYHVGRNTMDNSRDNHHVMHGMRKMWRTQEKRPDYIELMEAFNDPRNAPNAPYAKNNEKFKQFPELWKLISEGEM